MADETFDTPNKPEQRNVSTSVGLALHPGNLAEYESVLADAKDSITAPAYRATVAAFDRMSESITDMVAADNELRVVDDNHRVMKNGRVEHTMDDSVKERAANAMGVSFTRGSKLYDDARAEVERTAIALTSKIEGALTDPRRDQAHRVQNAAEVRAHVKAMQKPSERAHWVMQRIDQGDLTVATAILQGSCWAAGLEPEAFDLIRATAAAKFAPNESRKLETLGKLAAKLDTAGANYMKKYLAIVPRWQAARGAAALKKLES